MRRGVDPGPARVTVADGRTPAQVDQRRGRDIRRFGRSRANMARDDQ